MPASAKSAAYQAAATKERTAAKSTTKDQSRIAPSGTSPGGGGQPGDSRVTSNASTRTSDVTKNSNTTSINKNSDTASLQALANKAIQRATVAAPTLALGGKQFATDRLPGMSGTTAPTPEYNPARATQIAEKALDRIPGTNSLERVFGSVTAPKNTTVITKTPMAAVAVPQMAPSTAAYPYDDTGQPLRRTTEAQGSSIAEPSGPLFGDDFRAPPSALARPEVGGALTPPSAPSASQPLADLGASLATGVDALNQQFRDGADAIGRVGGPEVATGMSRFLQSVGFGGAPGAPRGGGGNSNSAMKWNEVVQPASRPGNKSKPPTIVPPTAGPPPAVDLLAKYLAEQKRILGESGNGLISF